MSRVNKTAAPQGEALDRMVETYLRDEVAHWAPHVREPDFPLARKMIEVFYRYDVGTLASVAAGYHVPQPRPHIKTMHLALVQTLRKVDKVLSETSGENPSDQILKIDAGGSRVWMPRGTLALCYADIDGEPVITRNSKHFAVVLATALYCQAIESPRIGVRLGTVIRLARYLAQELKLGTRLSETAAVQALRRSRGVNREDNTDQETEARDTTQCVLRLGAPFAVHYRFNDSKLLPLKPTPDEGDVLDVVKKAINQEPGLSGSEAAKIDAGSERAKAILDDWKDFALLFDIHGNAGNAFFSLNREHVWIGYSPRLREVVEKPAYKTLIETQQSKRYSAKFAGLTARDNAPDGRKLDLLQSRVMAHLKLCSREPSSGLVASVEQRATGMGAAASVFSPRQTSGNHASLLIAVLAMEQMLDEKTKEFYKSGFASWLRRHQSVKEGTFFQTLGTGSGELQTTAIRYTSLSTVSSIVCGRPVPEIQRALDAVADWTGFKNVIGPDRPVYDNVAMLFCADFLANALKTRILPNELKRLPEVRRIAGNRQLVARHLLSFGPMRLLPRKDYATVADVASLQSPREYAVCIFLASILAEPLDPTYLLHSVTEAADTLLSLKTRKTLPLLAPYILWIGLTFRRIANLLGPKTASGQRVISCSERLLTAGLDWLQRGGRYEQYATAECSAGIVYLLSGGNQRRHKSAAKARRRR